MGSFQGKYCSSMMIFRNSYLCSYRQQKGVCAWSILLNCCLVWVQWSNDYSKEEWELSGDRDMMSDHKDRRQMAGSSSGRMCYQQWSRLYWGSAGGSRRRLIDSDLFSFGVLNLGRFSSHTIFDFFAGAWQEYNANIMRIYFWPTFEIGAPSSNVK